MNPVKLPARRAWLCGVCANLQPSRRRAWRCCGQRDYDRGDYVLLIICAVCAISFVASLIPGLV